MIVLNLGVKFYNLGSKDDSLNTIKPTSDGGYIAVGNTLSGGTGLTNRNIWILKFDGDFNIAWERIFSGFDGDFPTDIIEIANQEYIVPFLSSSFGDQNGRFILKINNQGNILWAKQYVNSSYALYLLRKIQKTPDNMLYV